MEIGTKPIPISVLTAVTNLALNAASVFPSRRIEISDSHTDLNRSATFQYSGWTRLCKILKSRPFVPGNGRSLLPAHLHLARQVCPVHEAIVRGKTKYYHGVCTPRYKIITLEYATANRPLFSSFCKFRGRLPLLLQ